MTRNLCQDIRPENKKDVSKSQEKETQVIRCQRWKYIMQPVGKYFRI